ncbi:ion-transporting P-type ATPase [Paratrimastix pyriformis]|uniref:Ion-transporting P-type ATPase n=1 Tax=Paratrimastix pyriformis TaxID=342808 RepID=A0ABQ8URP9_9EUKA|nr:ion-transporting P-type ATPase [Paratrimastix pyriformis]
MSSFWMLFVLLVLNVGVTAFQEILSVSCLKALRFDTLDGCKSVVFRAGLWVSVPWRDVKKGETVYLSGGSVIFDDALILHVYEDPIVDESMITGDINPHPKTEGDHLPAGSFVLVCHSWVLSGSSAHQRTFQAGSFTGVVEAETHPPLALAQHSITLDSALGPLKTPITRVGSTLLVLSIMCLVAVLVFTPWSDNPFITNLSYSLSLMLAALPLAPQNTVATILAVSARALVLRDRRIAFNNLGALTALADMDCLIVGVPDVLAEDRVPSVLFSLLPECNRAMQTPARPRTILREAALASFPFPRSTPMDVAIRRILYPREGTQWTDEYRAAEVPRPEGRPRLRRFSQALLTSLVRDDSARLAAGDRWMAGGRRGSVAGVGAPIQPTTAMGSGHGRRQEGEVMAAATTQQVLPPPLLLQPQQQPFDRLMVAEGEDRGPPSPLDADSDDRRNAGPPPPFRDTAGDGHSHEPAPQPSQSFPGAAQAASPAQALTTHAGMVGTDHRAAPPFRLAVPSPADADLDAADVDGDDNGDGDAGLGAGTLATLGDALQRRYLVEGRFRRGPDMVEALVYDRRTRERYRLVKGPARPILSLLSDPSRHHALLDQLEAARSIHGLIFHALARAACRGPTEGVWELVGVLPLAFAPSLSLRAHRTIRGLREIRVDVWVFTCAPLQVAVGLCGELEGGGQVGTPETLLRAPLAAGRLHIGADITPEMKATCVAKLQAAGHSVGLVPEDHRDALAESQARLTLTGPGASNLERVRADVVLSDAGAVGTLAQTVVTARLILQRAHGYVLSRIAVTVQLLVFFTAAIFAWGIAPAPRELILIALLNTVVAALGWMDRIAGRAGDPVRWTLGTTALLGVVMGLWMAGSALFMVVFLQMDTTGGAWPVFSWTWARIQTPIDPDLLGTAGWFHLATLGLLGTLTLRLGSWGPFWPPPSLVFLSAVLVLIAAVILIAGTGVLGSRLPWAVIGGLLGYTVIAWIVDEFVRWAMVCLARRAARSGGARGIRRGSGSWALQQQQPTQR